MKLIPLATAAILAAIVLPSPASAAESKDADPKRTGSVQAEPAETQPAPICTKPRRRLWVEGEGWIVRRVAMFAAASQPDNMVSGAATCEAAKARLEADGSLLAGAAQWGRGSEPLGRAEFSGNVSRHLEDACKGAAVGQ